MPYKHSTASQRGGIAGIFVSLLIIAAAVVLVYIIEFPHRIDKQIEYTNKEDKAHVLMSRIAKQLELYKRDFGEYTERRLLLRRYDPRLDEDDPGVDQLRCPETFEPYEIDIVKVGNDTTYTIQSPYEPFGSIVHGVRTWNGRPVPVPADTLEIERVELVQRKSPDGGYTSSNYYTYKVKEEEKEDEETAEK